MEQHAYRSQQHGKSTSSSNDNVTRQKPPYSFVPLHQISKMLNNFGRNNSTIVEAKSAIASSGRHCGHTGNNCRGCRKYCGSVNACTTCNAVESARNINHSGAGEIRHHARQEHRTVNRVHTLHQNRRKFIRLPWHQRRSRFSSSSKLGGNSS